MDEVWKGLEGVHFAWVLLVGVLVVGLGYLKVAEVVKNRQVYGEGRVRKLESERRKVWERRQMEVDPDVGVEEVGGVRPEPKKFDSPKEPKKKFNRMFGMGNIAARSCNTGS